VKAIATIGVGVLTSLLTATPVTIREWPGLLQGRVVRPREEDALDLGGEVPEGFRNQQVRFFHRDNRQHSPLLRSCRANARLNARNSEGYGFNWITRREQVSPDA